MADIKSGLTVEGQPINDDSGDAFETYLAGQAGKSEPEAPTTPTARPDPARDSAADIAAGLLETTASNEIADGITVETPPEPATPAPEPVKLSDADQAIYDDAGRQLRADQLEREAGREALATLAELEYTATVESATTEDELVAAVAAYRERVPKEVADAALWDLAELLSGEDPDSEDDDGLEHTDALFRYYDARVRQLQTQQKASESAAMAEQLLPIAAQQRVQDLSDTYSRWTKDHGFTEEQAGQRLEAVRQSLAEDEGVDLGLLIQQPDFDPKEQFYRILNDFEAADFAVQKAEAVQAFQQEVAGATTTSISEGLTQQTPWGPMALQNLRIADVPQERINEFAARRASARRQLSADEIRKGVLESEGASIASGFTDGAGKPLSVDDATGAKERFRLEREADAARTRGLLR